MLLVSVVAIPFLLNKIPLATLAAVLLMIGYKLAVPNIKHFVKLMPNAINILVLLIVVLIVVLKNSHNNTVKIVATVVLLAQLIYVVFNYIKDRNFSVIVIFSFFCNYYCCCFYRFVKRSCFRDDYKYHIRSKREHAKSL
jgi:hypothetical protein